MLIDDAHRYVELRRALDFKLEKTARHLTTFTRHAVADGDSHIRTATALAWTAAVSSTPGNRYRRLQQIADFARFLHAEDAAHEIPQHQRYYRACVRPAPYIYAPDELERTLHAAANLRRQKPSPLRQHVHAMLIGLLAATGLRVSEALNLRLGDLLPDGVLHIRQAVIAIFERAGPEMLRMPHAHMIGENRVRFTDAAENMIARARRRKASPQMLLIGESQSQDSHI